MADQTHPPSLASFIIAEIEAAAPGVNGREVYMRGLARFSEYCANQYRAATTAQLAKYPPPKPLRAMRRARPRGAVR